MQNLRQLNIVGSAEFIQAFNKAIENIVKKTKY